MKSSAAPLPTEEARTANRLADLLLLVAGDYAEKHGLSAGGVFAAVTICLGRLTGGAAKQEGAVLDRLLSVVKRNLTQVARREFNRPRWTLQ